jgi:hypothetical protein
MPLARSFSEGGTMRRQLLAITLAAMFLTCSACSPPKAPPQPEGAPAYLYADPGPAVPEAFSREKILPASEIACILSLTEIGDALHSGGRPELFVLGFAADPVTISNIHRCLVMEVFHEDTEGQRWCVTHLFRDSEGKWRESKCHLFDKGWRWHSKWFKSRPGNDELFAAMADWEGVLYQDLAHSWVCAENWRAVTGEEPRYAPERK